MDDKIRGKKPVARIDIPLIADTEGFKIDPKEGVKRLGGPPTPKKEGVRVLRKRFPA